MKKLLLIIIGILITYGKTYAGDPGATIGWNALGTGLNGEVKAITYYNGNLIAAGSFTTAGGVQANRIAMWNGTSWTSLGQGLSGSAYAVAVYNNELYVGGDFTSAGGASYTTYIAKWNGSTWSTVGTGLNDEVTSFAVYNNELIVGGKFNVAGSYNIARWNGSSWLAMSSGTNDDVNSLTIWNNSVVAAGRFSTAGGNTAGKIAKWNGTTWSAILGSATFNDEIFSVGIYDNLLYAGGKFTVGSGVQANYLACFYNNQWVKVANGVEDRIYSILYYGHSLIVGGQQKFAYNTTDSVYVNRISVFNGTRWSGFSTGMNDKVNAVIEGPNGEIIAAGEFTTAGGRTANRIAIWDTLQQVSISGTVKYRGSSLPVTAGYVKAVRVDLNTRQVLVVDSVRITSGGNYTMTKVRKNDTIDVISFPDDELPTILDFVPTYYPSTPYWEGATRIFVNSNLTNIDVLVDTANMVSATGRINGQVILNYTPPGFIGSGLGLDFKSSAIVYAKLNGAYKNFGITNNYQMYSILSLPPGNYEVFANRLGYSSDTIIVTVTQGGTVDNVNFVLKPRNEPSGIDPKIELVKDFKLNQNYPNPFNPSTTIEFTLDKPGLVSLKIYNILGMEVASFYNEKLNSGNHMLKWNALGYSSGVYYYKLSFNGVEESRSMILVK